MAATALESCSSKARNERAPAILRSSIAGVLRAMAIARATSSGDTGGVGGAL